MSWPVLLELWHRVQIELLASDVPSERILPGGPVQLASLWTKHRHSLWDHQHANTLSLWKYDPTLDEPGENRPWKTSSGLHGAKEDHSARLEVCSQAEEEQDQAAQIWFSDVERYNLLALLMEELPFVKPNADKQPRETLIVLSHLRGNTKLAQHRPSSIRILSSIMRRHHQDLFDGHSEAVSDGEFWQSVFVGLLDTSWNIPDVRRLEQRFEWVLEYIREGKLPLEAQIAKDILREALNSTVLSSHKHRYNYDGDQETDGLLNPDLCPRWIKTFLAKAGVLFQVQDMIQSQMSDMSIDGFCNTYGLLIAQLWEEFIYSTKLLNPQDKAPQTIPMSPKQIPPSPMVLGTEGSRISMATADVEPDPQASAAPAELATLEEPEASEEPEPCRSVPHKAEKRKQAEWAGKEETHLKAFMELNITWPERSHRFNRKFEGPRTLASLKGKSRKLEEDCSSYLEQRQKSWTQAEKEHLRQLIATKESWDGVIQGSKEKFKTERSQMAMTHVANKHKWDLKRLTGVEYWTEDQDKFLATLRIDEVDVKNWPALFEKEFRVSRTAAALKRRMGKAGLTQKIRNKLLWTADEEEYMQTLIDLSLETVDTVEICRRFWKKFGQERSRRSILGKREQMQNVQQRETVPRLQKKWSIVEDEFLRALSGSIAQEDCYN